MVEARHITMDFRIDQNRTTNLKEFVVDTLRRQTHATTFRALDDVSFTAEKGSVTGLIGHNGAGKSTLLKIISGIYPPTSGSVALQGTLVPMLERGSGFDAELTGRENIFLNGAILGYPKDFLHDKAPEIIARIENGFREKFGVPRQSGLVPEVISRVVMAEKYSVREAFRGIEDYSHLWLLWEFDRAQQDDWRPTVRPPRLGGNTRLGVFATRSPFRPNRIGLTVVRLIRMEEENGRITLVVSGADLMDGTPIVDIKPYLPYVDSVPDAVGGFTEQTERHRLTVDFPEKLKKYVPKQNLPAVMGLLAQDPRPAYQHDGKRVYGVPYGEVDIRFVVEGDTLTVVEVVPYTEKEQKK